MPKRPPFQRPFTSHFRTPMQLGAVAYHRRAEHSQPVVLDCRPTMISQSPLGFAILDQLRMKSMSRMQLAEIARIKVTTLDATIAGTRKTRPETRKKIAKALGVTSERLYDLEQQFLRSSTATDESEASLLDRDALLLEILERVSGLPLAVARSIVGDFGVDSHQRNSNELETILRRKAQEYLELKAQLLRLSDQDPNVSALRDRALDLINSGLFDLAYDALASALKIDRETSRKAQGVAISRRKSEAETLLTTARLAAIRSRYKEALVALIEAHGLVRGHEPSIEHEAIGLAADYLNSEYREVGTEDTARRTIDFFRQILVPASDLYPISIKAKLNQKLADVYSMFGYRMSNNGMLRQAISLYRKILGNLGEESDPDLRLKCNIGLGDLVAELGLNRGSARQARVGVSIMRRGLADQFGTASPVGLAAGYVNLGTAQANLALVSKFVADYQYSIKSYDKALDAIRAVDEPMLRAQAHWGRAIALTGLGKASVVLDYFDQAEAACNAAIEYIHYGRYPIDWATIVQNRGNAKLERGKLENGVSSLLRAIDDYELALAVRTKKRFALGFAKTKGNAAIAKRMVAERRSELQLCLDARADIDEALNALPEEHNEYWRRYYGEERAQIEVAIERLSISRTPAALHDHS
jgi:tetratricopeptide (TPR) repeat protein